MKIFKSPERVYNVSMWIVTFIFASFLLGLGSKIISDLPKTSSAPQIKDFADKKIFELENKIHSLKTWESEISKEHDLKKQELITAQNDYQIAKTNQSNKLDSRHVTGNNKLTHSQDLELQNNNSNLEELTNKIRIKQINLEKLATDKIVANQQIQKLHQEKEILLDEATPKYQKELKFYEFKIFGFRLLFTLPLLLISVYLIRAKRSSSYWPLHRGFIIFSWFTFFSELVPYLPNYGGYIRYVFGLIFCIGAGHYGIKSMNKYLEKKKLEASISEKERRANMNNKEALDKMNASICPGCDHKIPASIDNVPVNHCVNCGLTLFKNCSHCDKRNNAFYTHCAFCGEELNDREQPSTDVQHN